METSGNTPPPILEASNIGKSYGSLAILRGVSLQIHRGEVVTIVGASGAGKSTLLHIAGTLDKPDAGEIIINQTLVSALSARELAQFRNAHIGFVFQFHHLLPEFTALENVCIPGWVGSRKKAQENSRAQELLGMMGLGNRLHHKPKTLSGGEQQRVAVARALINQPDIVFADEPTGNLDSQHAQELHALFFTLRQQLNQTFLIVTHNPQLAGLSDRTLTMKDGLILP